MASPTADTLVRISPDRRATAHRARPAGTGWRTDCGRFVSTEPGPAAANAPRCHTCIVAPGTDPRTRAWAAGAPQPETAGA